MHSITTAEMTGSQDMWTVISALRLLDESAQLTAAAGSEVMNLADDAHWETKGVRRLRTALLELRGTLQGELIELRYHHDRLQRVAAS